MSKEAKVVVSFLAWFLGSAAVGGLLSNFITARPLLDWIVIGFVVLWGIACIWLFNHL
ncbi:MAG: hypothetical protein ABID87_01755 [Chloroflexota bacterium]